MKRFLLFAAASLAVIAGFATPAQARTAATPTGNDISWPQCGRTYPSAQAFAIVGLNGGKANNVNPCFDAQWAWAQTSKGGTSQARAQLYLNTGDPGDVLAQYDVTTWPTTSVSADPYGTCSGTWTDNLPCSWEYGYERAQADLSWFNNGTRVAPSGNWWLDIETSNSWTSDHAKNQASLEGMVYALQHAGAGVGIYASSGSWSSLFGPVGVSSSLYSLAEWRPGAKTLTNARTNCALAPFEGNGKVVITQYVSTNLDFDFSCP
ncbi:MAG TPA: hypothetical protein VGN35_03820 [Jatrophihabitantaceae bacterium]|nr:hypothetical protein [Jatrophihabitantaceae bacterium]